jgi:outer membrane protein assembly factor BamB
VRRPPLRVWVWTAATLALVVVAALLWRNSDAAATESTTSVPADVPLGTPAGAVSEIWTAEGGALPGDVVEAGRVIVGSAHGVRALDAVTGEEAWRYTRSNAWLCGVTATDGVVVAVFRTADRCDEAVALRAGTGVRVWTRNVNFRGDATLASTDRIVLASSPTGVVTLDPTGNNIRWRYNPPGACRLLDTDVGSAGVALLQRCAGGTAVQLRLFDGFEGSEHWTVSLPVPEGTVVRLTGAGRPLGVVVGNELQVVSPADGAVLRTLPVTGGAEQAQLGAVGLFWTGDAVHAVEAATGAPLWEAPATGLPAEAQPAKQPDRAAPLVVPTAEGFVHLDAVSGAEVGRSAVADLPTGGTVDTVGPVLVYRLADRVIAYR